MYIVSKLYMFLRHTLYQAEIAALIPVIGVHVLRETLSGNTPDDNL